MEQHSTTSRAEAERLLGIAEKLLRNKDFAACRDFAILAQETEPLLEGSEQILAIADVLLAAENKKLAKNKPDWYAILQIPQRSEETELIKKQYRRLALLLHPDKNKLPFSDSAFRLVADSWAVLSDPAKKSAYDSEFVSRFTKVDLVATKQKHQQKGDDSHQKLPVRRSTRGQAVDIDTDFTPSGGGGGTKYRKKTNTSNVGSGSGPTFWTACPYCYNLYEYQRIYDGCCLRCDNCKRAFTATEILSMPPIVPGKEAYYCCWGFFPMSFTAGNVEAGVNGFPKWMPPIYGNDPPAPATAIPTATAVMEEETTAPPPQIVTPVSAAPPPQIVTPVSAAPPQSQPIQRPGGSTTGKKRGRPRKNP